MFLTKIRAATIGTTTAVVAIVGVMSDSMGLIAYFSSNSTNAPNIVITGAGERQKIDKLYQELSQPALAKKYDNDTVTVTMTYLGLWGETNLYAMGGIQTDDQLFIAHRGPNYQPSNNAFGSSDGELPPFVVALPPAALNQIEDLEKYQKIKVIGSVHSSGDMHNEFTPAFAKVLIKSSQIEPLD